MTVRDTRFMRKLVERFAQLAYFQAKPHIPSRTLRRGLNIFVTDDTHSRIQIPHYWALYVHDGRGPFGPRKAKVIVWFRNPKDDPRLRGGNQPVRAKDIKRLTAHQYFQGLKRNRQARAAGQPIPMIVTPFVGKSTPPTRFFENSPGGGMEGFVDTANKEGARLFREHIKKSMGTLWSIRGDVKIKL